MAATRRLWIFPGVLALAVALAGPPATGAPRKARSARTKRAPKARAAKRQAKPRRKRSAHPAVARLQNRAHEALLQARQLRQRVVHLRRKLARAPRAKAKPLQEELAKVQRGLAAARRAVHRSRRQARALARRLARQAHRSRLRDHRLGQIARAFKARGFTGVRFEEVRKLARKIPDLGKLVPMGVIVARLAKLERQGKALPGDPLILEMKRWREARKRGEVPKGSLPPGALTKQERKLYQRQYVGKLVPDLVRYVSFIAQEVFRRSGKPPSTAEAVDLLHFYGCKRISRLLPGFARVVKKRVSRDVDLMGDWDREVSPEAFAKKPRGKRGKAPPLKKPSRVKIVEVCTVTHRQLDATLRADLGRIAKPMLRRWSRSRRAPRPLRVLSAGTKANPKALAHFAPLIRRVESKFRIDTGAVCLRFGDLRPVVYAPPPKAAGRRRRGQKRRRRARVRVFCRTRAAILRPPDFRPRCRRLDRLRRRAQRACTLRDRRGRKKRNPRCRARPLICRVSWRRMCNQTHRRRAGGRLLARIGGRGKVSCRLRRSARRRIIARFLLHRSLKKFGLESETLGSIAKHLVGFYRKRGDLRNFRRAMKHSGARIAELGGNAPARAKAEMGQQTKASTVRIRNRREILRRTVAQWTDGYQYEQLGAYVKRKPALLSLYRPAERRELGRFWGDCGELHAICQEPRAGAEKKACYDCALKTLRHHCVEGGDGNACRGKSEVRFVHVPTRQEQHHTTDEFPNGSDRLGGNTFLNWLILQAWWEPYQMDFHAGTPVFDANNFRTAVVRNVVARKFLPPRIDDDKGLTNQGKRYLDSLPLSSWQQCVLWNPFFDVKALRGAAPDACADPDQSMKQLKDAKGKEGIPWERAVLFRTVLGDPRVSGAIAEMSQWWQKACKETKTIAEATRTWLFFRGKTRYREVKVRDCEKDAADARTRTAELFGDQQQLGINRDQTLKDSGSAISGVLGPVVGKLLDMLLKASGMGQMMKTLARAAGLNPEQSADCEDPEYRREQMKLPPKQDNKRGCLLKVFAKNFGNVLESVIVMLGNKLVDWGVDLLRVLLQAVKSALIAAAGSVPFVGGVLATLVDIAWELLMNFGAKGLLKHFVVAKLPEWLKVKELATQAWEKILQNPIVQVVAGVILQLIDAAVTYGGKGWMTVGIDTVLNTVQVFLQNKREFFWLRALIYAKKEMAKTASATGSIAEQLLGVAKGMVRGFGAAVARRLDPDTRLAFDEAMTAVEALVSGSGLAQLQRDPIGTLVGLLRQKLAPLVLPIVSSLANLPSWARSMLEPVSAGIADLLRGKRPSPREVLGRIADAVKPLAEELLGRIPFGDDATRELALQVAGAAEWSLRNLDRLKKEYLDQPGRIAQVFFDLAGGFLRRKARQVTERARSRAKEVRQLLERGLNAAARVLTKSAPQWFGKDAVPGFGDVLGKLGPALATAPAGPLSLAEWRALGASAGRRVFVHLVQQLLGRALGYAPIQRLLTGIAAAMEVLLAGLPTVSPRALMSRVLPKLAGPLEAFGQTVLLAPLRGQRAAYFLMQEVLGAGVGLLQAPEKASGLMRLLDEVGGGARRLGARIKTIVGGLAGKLVGFVGSPALGKVLQAALGFALKRL